MSPLEKAAIAAAEVLREQKERALYFDGMEIARAVLLAVREPDEDTYWKGQFAQEGYVTGPGDAGIAFTAMIDAILEGE